jgi:hypothetical protein
MRRKLVLAVAAIFFANAALASPNRMRVGKPRPAPPQGEESGSKPRHGLFDGPWVFDVTTTVGDCPALISNVVGIEDDRIASIDDEAVSPWGYVDEDGTFVGRLTRQGGRVARVHGRLNGSAGSGAWSSSTDFCGGTWRASRVSVSGNAGPTRRRSRRL